MPIFLGILGIGALILWAGTSSAGTSQQGSTPSAWPPSQADISATAQQVWGYAQNTGELQPTDSFPAFVSLVTDTTQTYAQQCASQGIAPTTAGWKAWVMSSWVSGLQQTGIAPGSDPNQGPYGNPPFGGASNPYIDPQWPS